MTRLRARRIIMVVLLCALVFMYLSRSPDSYTDQPTAGPTSSAETTSVEPPSKASTTPSAHEQIVPYKAADALALLAVKGRAAKTGYSRAQFGDGWARKGQCDMRNIILARDMDNEKVDTACKVTNGTLHDPYTGNDITFVRGPDTSDDVQLDHVVALSNAWQTGAQQLTREERISLANDPLELLAVDGDANQKKLDSDAASWLPSNKPFRCQYVARQIAVKLKYHLWVTKPEKTAMMTVLGTCPEQLLPSQ